MNERVNPVITTFLYKTLPTETSEKFVEGYLCNIQQLYDLNELKDAKVDFTLSGKKIESWIRI
ncbi:MAG: hypothetical protein M0T74_01500 [Desulfitobacterium hafniense]|nr:hypothetical protein [Desulfitobacterium hafniense]